jgi:mannose-1-phosphate guanylyltransferase
MTNIILSDGSSTSLWTISRTLMPKQFNNKLSFQLTVGIGRFIEWYREFYKKDLYLT